MMKSVILASLVTASAAFAPSQQQGGRVSSVAVNEFANGYVGGEGPEPMFIGKDGSKNFDPAGFTEKVPEWIPWFREAEIKHGRVAMLAVN